MDETRVDENARTPGTPAVDAGYEPDSADLPASNGSSPASPSAPSMPAAALADLLADRSRLRVGDDDDPVLLGPDGAHIDTWREGYPYDARLTRAEYEMVKRLLQIELLKLQNWVRSTGARIVVQFEGRDAAGKGGTTPPTRRGR